MDTVQNHKINLNQNKYMITDHLQINKNSKYNEITMIEYIISHNPLYLNTISQHPPSLRGKMLFSWCPVAVESCCQGVGGGGGLDCSLIQDERECDN